MILISICLLMAPGLIALKLCYRIIKKDAITIKNSISDYGVVSFFIILLSYLLMYISNPDRMVSFNPFNPITASDIYHAGFVVKYALSALGASIITGVGFAFSKMNPIRLFRELKSELEKEKNEIIK